MNPNEAFLKAIERLRIASDLDVAYIESAYTRTNSCVMLFFEYCRRMTFWAEALDCRKKWPMFDVAAKINESWRIDDDLLENIFRENKIPGPAIGSPRYSVAVMRWYVHWELRKDEEELKKFGLTNPYEPIIVMLERGGWVEREHGYYQVLAGGMITTKWDQLHTDVPCIMLDKGSLEKADQEYNELRNSL